MRLIKRWRVVSAVSFPRAYKRDVIGVFIITLEAHVPDLSGFPQ